MNMDVIPEFQAPPAYCQYVVGACDQIFPTPGHQAEAIFLFSSSPTTIAGTVESAVSLLRDSGSPVSSWKDLPIHGQMIFCEICKAVRFSSTVIADVTTLNFNVLFEIGYAIGLGLPIIPIRDPSYGADTSDFRSLGVLDTLGYLEFGNASELAEKLKARLPAESLPAMRAKHFQETPLYILGGNQATEGSSQMVSTIKKAKFKYRTFDPVESPRLSLGEARRQVSGSAAIIAHLLDPQRPGARANNARCALICGLALAQQKVVLMVQEGDAEQPIDYQDVVQSYSDPREVPSIIENFIPQIVEGLQRVTHSGQAPPSKILEKVDLGDTAAENEITRLPDYFVRTGQFRHAYQGNARLVVGRKGSGKTAMFYEIREELGITRSRVVLDMRPEGHQFTKLREAVLDKLSEGNRLHALTAFWNYILLVEILLMVVRHEAKYAKLDGQRFERYSKLVDLAETHVVGEDEDLSQRLYRQVDRIADRMSEEGFSPEDGGITQLIFGGDIRVLNDAVSEYLDDKDEVWLLMDNLDKSWPVRGTDSVDIQILQGLLEATRKLQRQMEQRMVEFRCLVFLRTDVFEHLLAETSDKGKDTVIRLDWDDPDLFADIVLKRIEASLGQSFRFEEVWPDLFESHIGPIPSFEYLLSRTLMRPRDLLMFVQRAIEVALNRGHVRVGKDDLLQAEDSFSGDMLTFLDFEMRDTDPEMADTLYAFIDAPVQFNEDGARDMLRSISMPEERIDPALDLLLWFGFLGVESNTQDGGTRYAHEVQYNLRLLRAPLVSQRAKLTVHPAFRPALEIQDPSRPNRE